MLLGARNQILGARKVYLELRIRFLVPTRSISIIIIWNQESAENQIIGAKIDTPGIKNQIIGVACFGPAGFRGEGVSGGPGHGRIGYNPTSSSAA